MIVLPKLKTARSYFHSPGQTPECDGRIHRQTDRIPLTITAVCIGSNADAV